MEFKDSLQYGKQIEQDVLNTLREKYPSAVMIEGKFKGYDIWIPETSESVEVKSDQKSKYTGNLVVEVFMHGKLSGIMTSKATYWVFYTGHEYIWIKRTNLLKNIILWNNPHVSFIGDGDTAEKRAWLVPVELIKKWGTVKTL